MLNSCAGSGSFKIIVVLFYTYIHMVSGPISDYSGHAIDYSVLPPINQLASIFVIIAHFEAISRHNSSSCFILISYYSSSSISLLIYLLIQVNIQHMHKLILQLVQMLFIQVALTLFFPSCFT